MTPAAPFRLAVDAAALTRDRRGMGRLARGVLALARADKSIALTLLAGGSDVKALRAEFGDTIVRPPASAGFRKRYDVVWYPFNGMRFGAAAPRLVSIADAFAFTQAHPERIARGREQGPIRRAAREATRIVTLSNWSRGEIARELALDPASIDVIAPDPDPYWFPALGDVLPQGIAGKRFALVVGVREARKNARLAIDACAAALRGPGELLVVAGTLSPQDRRRTIELGLPCGEVTPSDALLRALYRNADAVLVPSFAEGFGLVTVEALACAAPVIAANTSALPEAAGDAALLLDPRDVEGWARAIREFFDGGAKTSAIRARAAARFAFSDRTAAARKTLALLRATAAMPAKR